MNDSLTYPEKIGQYLFPFSLFAILYFSFLFFNHEIFHLQNPFIGVIQELFTIPMMLATLMALVISSIQTFKQKLSIYNLSMYSMVLTLSVSIFIVVSFL